MLLASGVIDIIKNALEDKLFSAVLPGYGLPVAFLTLPVPL